MTKILEFLFDVGWIGPLVSLLIGLLNLSAVSVIQVAEWCLNPF